MKPDRIRLINCDEKLLQVILKGDDYLAKELDLQIPDQWSEFGQEIFEFTLSQIKEKPAALKWFSYLPVDLETKTLLGTCGYKGEPDEKGMVEIGYEVAKDFRNQGYATEITKLLVKKAFADAKVKEVQAHTLANKNASVSVLKKCDFQFVKEYLDEEDGLIWRWRKER